MAKKTVIATVSFVGIILFFVFAVSSCNTPHTKKITLPSGTEMKVTAESVHNIISDGPFISGDGVKRVWVYYLVEYTLPDSTALVLCQALEGEKLGGAVADIYYYRQQTESFRAEIEREVCSKSIRELQSDPYKKEVQSRLDKIHPEYLPDFKITLANIGW
jgi:hypothetical protein